MSAYVVGHVTVTNPEGYAGYSSRVPETLAPHGGEFLVRGGNPTVLEGEMPQNRHVVIRFPDRAAAEAWYGSPEYQEIIAIRHAHSTGILMIVEGYE